MWGCGCLGSSGRVGTTTGMVTMVVPPCRGVVTTGTPSITGAGAGGGHRFVDVDDGDSQCLFVRVDAVAGPDDDFVRVVGADVGWGLRSSGR